MTKKVLEENLKYLGLPDRAAFDAMVDLTPEAIPLKDEMLEVLESISADDLKDFMEDPFPTPLAIALQKIRTDE